MRTLDRYILGQFLTNFAVLLSVLLTLFVLVDLLVDVDKFIRAGQERAERAGESLAVAVIISAMAYYGPLLLTLYGLFSGLLVATAAGFTFSGLSRRGELTAMFASGLPGLRVAAPVLIVGALLNGLSLPLHEYVLPGLSQRIMGGKSHALAAQTRGGLGWPVTFARDGAGHLLSAEAFVQESELLVRPTILLRDQRGRARRRIVADSAFWDPASRAWMLRGGRATDAPAWSGRVKPSGRPDEAAVDRFATDLSPTALLARQAEGTTQLFSAATLQRLATNPSLSRRQRSGIRRALHDRFSSVVLNSLLPLLALPAMMPRAPGALGPRMLLAAVVVAGFWGAAKLLSLGAGLWLGPVSSSWLPVAVGLPLAGWMACSVRS